jgi:hypothetical protein
MSTYCVKSKRKKVKRCMGSTESTYKQKGKISALQGKVDKVEGEK